MKRHLFLHCILFFCLLLSMIFVGCNPTNLDGPDPMEPRMSVTGRYIRGRSSQDMILVEEEHSNQAVSIMGNSTGDETVFENFQTGDRIRILCNNFRETYPAQTDVFECEWLEAGSIADIPQHVIEHLTSLGHLDEAIVAKMHRYVDGKDIDLQATYRALWGYHEIDMIEDAKIKYAGLQLYSWSDREMTIDVLYYPDRYTMEALPVLSKETISLDSGLTATVYTQKTKDGKELVTAVFESFDHKFIAQYRWNHAWKERYQEEVQQILNSITITIQ